MKKLFLFFFICTLSNAVIAQVSLSNYFSDHMVLQRNQPIVIWGKGAVGEKISVSFKSQNKTTTTDKNGDWRIALSPEKEGGPYELKVKGKNEIVLTDILMGDVWVCSGQSNMEWNMSSVENAEKEKNEANFPQIRQIQIQKEISREPLQDIQPTVWKVATPENISNFTAVGYYFARKLLAETNIPIGLINTSWGGTNIETWISATSLSTHPDYKAIVSITPGEYNDMLEKQKQKVLSSVSKFQNNNIPTKETEWKTPQFDDSKWSTLKVPQEWENQGLNHIDGIVWYRKEITLTKQQAENASLLSLGLIDDKDITYVNGQNVGSTMMYNVARTYTLNKNIFKEGKNIIAVRVEDNGGGGGFYGDPEEVYLQSGDEKISLAGDWKARVIPESIYFDVRSPNHFPSLLYNAMIHPFIQTRVKGFIWYQGETNSGAARQYETVFPLLIKDWREKWQQGNLPFYFVQLASYDAGGGNANGLTGSGWAELRDAQRKTLKVPNTGMALTTDIGDAKDIHPRNKKDVGIRLALNALKNDYGKNIVPMGPLYKSMNVTENKAVISFDHVGCGLMARNQDYDLKGFQIAGADQKFHWAKAKIVGDKVEVWNDDVARPVAVRYGWTDVTDDINLYNKEGLPASPFRTDDWKGLTDNNKYQIVF